jgi:hypothetical protein
MPHTEHREPGPERDLLRCPAEVGAEARALQAELLGQVDECRELCRESGALRRDLHASLVRMRRPVGRLRQGSGQGVPTTVAAGQE